MTEMTEAEVAEAIESLVEEANENFQEAVVNAMALFDDVFDDIEDKLTEIDENAIVTFPGDLERLKRDLGNWLGYRMFETTEVELGGGEE